ncbi:HAD family hydrolase [uncultured Abiotrophia sp.]|uniref:HAD family hydrolase n=1 Tax=uncultured Abiotrophia sp. TaxID=316094 RepID=UPI00260707EC|nr:HAD family hydrolase [uncultured Abiotrophia sp.]
MTNAGNMVINTRIVAFDFFDTLVHRDCHPEVVLYEWAKEVAAYMKYRVSPSQIYDCRKEVEFRFKQQSGEEMPYDSLLGDTYSRLLPNELEDIDLKNEWVDAAKSIELQAELAHLTIDSETIALVEKLYREGKVLIVISDFYADYNFLRNIMTSLDIGQYFSQIFVSSSTGCRKSTGRLYQYVCQQLDLSYDELTMLGDNEQSDVKVPRNMGIKAIWRPYEDPHSMIDYSGLFKKYQQILFKNPDGEPFNGYLADILFFVSKLHCHLVAQGAKKVLFCAREGQLLKRLFDIYQASVSNELLIESVYFYVSRRSTLYPSFLSAKEESFETIFRQYQHISLNNFLLNLNFETKEIAQIFEDLHATSESIVTSDGELLSKLRQNPTFIYRYELERKQGEDFRSYIEGLVGDEESIYLVDIGWKGSIQDNIQRALPDKIIYGYYLGLMLNAYPVKNKNQKYGMLFTDYPVKSKGYSLLSRNFEFYEDIFVADHGPTLSYHRLEDDMIEPVLDMKEEHLQLYRLVLNYQEALVKGFCELVDAYQYTKWLPYELEELLLRMALKKECKFLPQLLPLREEIRNKSTENFGEIVKKPHKISIKRKIKDKRDFLWVDYAYKPFDRVKCIPKMYTSFVYGLKRLGYAIKGWK